jgi:hypothetical protein
MVGMNPKNLLLPAFLFLIIQSFAGGIKGRIKADDGTPLAFASIFVKQTSSGAATDLNGNYEIILAPGTYTVLFQYLGYETISKTIEVGSDFQQVDITLKTQVVMLQTVTVKANKEDPAYTVMRKAIGKAKYHTQQVDTYTAKVYIKGKGKLKDYPWFAKKALEKEGITKDRLFITESVSEIKYTRPNKFEEKVIAVYTQGKNNNASPNAYIFGSFYQPEIAETVSPLSPKSFSYYRFEYLGAFKDRGFEISKIKVIPRSPGDNVFEGVIFIVEDWWCIHSLDIKATKLGIQFQVKQIYNPIEDDNQQTKGQAWMPVSQQAVVSGKVFGFEFEGTYLATVKDYKIKLNKDLPPEIKVVDEKIDKEEATKLAKTEKAKKSQDIKQRLENGKEITNKELKKVMKEYEKEEREKEKEPEVLSETKYTVDSTAYKKDSTFWTEIRPTPLDKEEVRGYHKNDSISEVQRKRDEGDTLRSKRKHGKGFQVYDVLIGDSYTTGKNSNFEIQTPWGGYNTVEGVNLIYRMNYFHRWVKKDTTKKDKRPETKRLEISPVLRYAFAREKLTGFLRFDYRTRTSRITLSGGRYIQQFNNREPIHPIINTYTTLVEGHNWMKIYEREFVDLNFRKRFNDKYTFHTNWSLARRHELFNNNDYSFTEKSKERFTPNAPVNVESPSTSFNEHNAFIGEIGIEARPWQKYRIRNGNKYRADRTTPVFSLDYRKGFNSIFNSAIDYDLVELGIRQGYRLGIRGTLDVNLKAGKFFNNNKIYFMDYAHFMGNQTFLMTTDPVGSFRLLDYYKFSTRDQYLSASVHYHFRKFVLSRIPKLRLMGVTESFFTSYLKTPSSKNYTEVGYGINGILRLFRIEFAASFEDGSNVNQGFRIGISSNLSVRFSDN